MTIYELTQEMKALLDMLEDEEDDQAVQDTLEAVSLDFQDKAEGYCMVVNQMCSEAADIREEEKRLAERRRHLEARADKLQETLHQAMKATSQKKIQTGLFTLTLRPTAKVVIDNADKIPLELLTFKDPEPNKAEIKKYLKDNSVDWAHIETGTSLSIR